LDSERRHPHAGTGEATCASDISRLLAGPGLVAAMSPATANEAALIFSAVLILLLAVSLLAVARTPPWTGTTAEDTPGPGQEPAPTGPAEQFPQRSWYAPAEAGRAPLPVRAPGQSGRTAPAAPSAVPPPDGSWRPRVAGGPPWGPAPRPPGA